jgi:hypothetical protein
MMRTLTGLLLLTTVIAGAPTVTNAQSGGDATDGETLRSTRDTLAKWVETQKIISKEKKDWQLGREVLTQRIALMEGEIEALEGQIAETDELITDADEKRAELVREKDRLKEASASLAEIIVELENKTKRLLAALPEPLVERVGLLAQRIPKDAATTELALSERYQNVIGVLNEVNKFNGMITVATELRELPSGKTAEVQTMYVGLGQAYYVTPDGEAAGVGRPTEAGWEWTASDELAPRVQQAIAILKNEDVPAYVPLPVKIQ